MLWLVWGLLGWLPNRLKPVGVGALVLLIGGYNLYVLLRVVSPRYYGRTGWWDQCEQIATLWPVPAWSVAAIDAVAVGALIAAGGVLIAASRRRVG